MSKSCVYLFVSLIMAEPLRGRACVHARVCLKRMAELLRECVCVCVCVPERPHALASTEIKESN